MNRKIKTALKSFSNFITIPTRIVKQRKIASIPNNKSVEKFDSETPLSNHGIFDEDFYLRLYPDIAAAKIDPYAHFIKHGKAEGRIGTPYNLRKDITPLCETKKTILVVSHDASRTGAPILALNIAQELKKQFNVIVLLLNGGNITSFFEENCNTIISINRVVLSDGAFINDLVNQLIERYSIEFSILNSIESFRILEPLAKGFIPSVLLIHEFAAYYPRPLYNFIESFFWAGAIVFPAQVVQKNALSIQNENALHRTHILPQGKSHVPKEVDERKDSLDVVKLFTQDNKNQSQSKPFIVLGAGFVQYRKGVDLFIATAAELKRSYPKLNIKMLWVGSGYDPENDFLYSCYLAEQIERSGLQGSFKLIGELSDLEELYSQIDLFYLSSRLDPLPNVAIDAMSVGKPVICFDKATGIVEILEKDKNTAECVMSHMSIFDATKKIVQFYNSPKYYSLISSQVKKLAQSHFNMNNYVANLTGFFNNLTVLAKQEADDCIILNESTEFKEAFFLKPGADRYDAIRRYVRFWHNKMSYLRKPAPGFNPSIYALQHGCKNQHTEPFADYLRSGKPEGPWQERVLIPNNNLVLKEKKKLRCAIHIHAFYSDLLQDIMDRIQMNESAFDVYVSTSESLFSQVSQILSNYQQIKSKISIVPNKGRDLGPLLSEFNDELQMYDVIGHFHTKKSKDISTNEQNAQFVNDWFLFLIENLLGGQHRMADQIMNEFKKDAKLGLVFADDPHVLDWGENRPFANELADRMQLSSLPDHQFNYPAGNMFWARAEAIRPLFELQYTWDMYPEEPLPYDGSILHAMERIIPFIATNQGFSRVVTHIPGITR